MMEFSWDGGDWHHEWMFWICVYFVCMPVLSPCSSVSANNNYWQIIWDSHFNVWITVYHKCDVHWCGSLPYPCYLYSMPNSKLPPQAMIPSPPVKPMLLPWFSNRIDNSEVPKVGPSPSHAKNGASGKACESTADLSSLEASGPNTGRAMVLGWGTEEEGWGSGRDCNSDDGRYQVGTSRPDRGVTKHWVIFRLGGWGGRLLRELLDVLNFVLKGSFAYYLKLLQPLRHHLQLPSPYWVVVWGDR